MFNHPKFIPSLFLLAGVASAMTLVACGDDDKDEEEEALAVQPQSVITDLEGNPQLVTQLGDVSFTYEDGKLRSFGNDERTYTIDGDNFVLSVGDSVDYDIRLNSEGFISQLSTSGDYTDEDGSGTVEVSIVCTYSNQRLTQVKSIMNDSYAVSGIGQETASDTIILRNTWSGDGSLAKTEITDVTKIVVSLTGQGMGNSLRTMTGSISQTSSQTFTFSNGDVENPLGQMPYFVTEIITGGVLSLVGPVGYYGKGPAVLPSSVASEWTSTIEADGVMLGEVQTGTESDSEDFTLAFAMNENGTIDIEERFKGDAESDNVTDHEELYYSYDAYTSSVDATAAQVTDLLGTARAQLKALRKGRGHFLAQ